MPQLSDLLMQVSMAYDSISAETISAQILSSSKERLVEQLAKNGFSLGETITADKKLFATEDPRLIFVEFLLRYQCPDLTDTGRAPATLTVKGDGSYDAEAQVFRDHRTLSEIIQFRGEDGIDQEVRNAFLYAEGFMIGHKEVRNNIRYPVPNA